MTDELIETLLSQAPCPVPPADLLDRLHADIVLPQRAGHTRNNSNPLGKPLRRWIPAVVFGIFLLTCVIVIGVQANQISQLRQQNQALRAATANLEASRRQTNRADNPRAQLTELEQLRKDNQDLRRLRAEVEQLRGEVQDTERLRAETERLLAASLAAGTASPDDRFFDEAQKRAERVACINNLKQIGLSVRVWVQDNEGQIPTSVIEMSNELYRTSCLICPSDKTKQAFAVLSWSAFRPEMTSYQLFLSGERNYPAVQPGEPKYPDAILAKCPIHHLYCLADSSVPGDPSKFREVQINGRWHLKRIENPTAGSQP